MEGFKKIKGIAGKAAEKAKSIGFPARRSSSLESASGKQPSCVLSQEDPLTPLGGLPPEFFGDSVYDCCAFLILCPEHQKIALTKSNLTKGSWLPFVALKTSDGMISTAIAGVSYVLSDGDTRTLSKLPKLPFTTPEIIHILRLQRHKEAKFFTRTIFIARIINEVKEWKCCSNTNNIQWFEKDDVLAGNVEKLWGPEPYLFAGWAMEANIVKREFLEYSTNEALKFLPQEPLQNKEEALVKTSNFTENDVIHIYNDYINHCYPALYMTLSSFQAFMAKLGWASTDVALVAVFRAFNYRGNGYLTFHEMLLGMAAMDPNTEHGGHSGALRCGYIFRYYDVNNDGLLDFSDIQRMTGDIYRVDKEEADEKKIEKESKARMEQLKLKTTENIQFSQFLKAVADKTIRGTSGLFRSEKPIVQQLTAHKGKEVAVEVSPDTPPMVAKLIFNGTCPACKEKPFRICTYSVQVDFTGRIIEPQSMIESEGADLDWKINDTITEQLRTFSRETVFNPAASPNTLLDILRQFNNIQRKRIEKIKPDVKHWSEQENEQILTAVQTICKKAEEVFAQETRCIKITSPVLVFGDTHGNIADVLTYERNMWRGAPAVCPCSFLFLGDYVDRGEFGVELVCYLFSMKILAPDKFFLTRGNHEIRSIQKCFTFLKECNTKYGKKVGPQVFEACNLVFDRMPMCAVIDDNIFGAHGGIPTSLTRIEDLMRLPTPLQEPEADSPAAWEMVWNDPMNKTEFIELAEFMKVKTDQLNGFLSNTKRGTAFYYTEEAVDNFLKVNDLQYILRGHEVFPLGYKFHLQGKVTTLFSSSRYCNGTNEASAMYCNSEEMRVVRFETYGKLEEESSSKKESF